MVTKLVSFGFKHGGPGGPLYVDVREHFSRNPFRIKALREFTGKDPQVAADILLTPGFEEAYRKLKRLVKALGESETVVEDGEPVWIGCTGGRHRSVYLAERLGKELGIPVEHRDLDKVGG